MLASSLARPPGMPALSYRCLSCGGKLLQQGDPLIPSQERDTLMRWCSHEMVLLVCCICREQAEAAAAAASAASDALLPADAALRSAAEQAGLPPEQRPGSAQHFSEAGPQQQQQLPAANSVPSASQPQLNAGPAKAEEKQHEEAVDHGGWSGWQ